MPVNSFDNYYMSFKPDKSRLKKPYFKSLVRLMEEDILSGALPPHTKLPPQRELADWLDLSLSTVTRAYALRERTGLTYAITGNGTYISPDSNMSVSIINNTRHIPAVNMSAVVSFPEVNNVIAKEINEFHLNFSAKNLHYDGSQANDDFSDVYLKWFLRLGFDASDRYNFVTYGAQNALSVILYALFSNGSHIATDEYTYPNFRKLCQRLGIKLHPVKGDEKGIIPGELEKCCEENEISGLFVVPILHNPMGYTMDRQRKKRLNEIVMRNNLILIEDDVYNFSTDTRNIPMSAQLPKNGIYINSVSKLLSNGLRIAYVSAPKRYRNMLQECQRNINLFTAPVISDIAVALCVSDMPQKVGEHKMSLAKKRNILFDDLFKTDSSVYSVPPLFRWLEIPKKFDNMSGIKFEQTATEKGVLVYHSDRFAVGNTNRDGKKYIRISISTPSTDEEYIVGLTRLYEFLYK